MSKRSSAATLPTALLLALAGTAHSEPSFNGVGDLPGGLLFSEARAVAGNGDAVAAYSESDSRREAVRWRAGVGLESLQSLAPHLNSMPYASSGDGAIIVGDSGAQAFLWREGEGMTPLGFLTAGQTFSRAQGVSRDGAVIVGEAQSLKGVEAFRFTEADGMVGLSDLPGFAFSSSANGVSPDGSVIVGQGYSYDGFQAFMWTETGGMVGLGDLPGGLFASDATDASEDGAYIVGRGLSADGNEAFRYSDSDGMVGLGDLDLGRFFSQANAISADGRTVVGFGHGITGKRAVIWRGGAPEALKDVLENEYALDLTGWRLTEALDVSDDGLVVVGNGRNPDGESEGWIADMRTAPPLACPTDIVIELWPPSRRMKKIDIAAVTGMTSPTSDPIRFVVTSITQDEPVTGTRFSRPESDGFGVGSSVASVRAERLGWSNGRVYEVNYTATVGDDSCDGVVTAHVPIREGSTAIDDGQEFDSAQFALVGDLNGDGAVKGDDLAALLAAWNDATPSANDSASAADLNEDGRVNMRDVKILIAAMQISGKDKSRLIRTMRRSDGESLDRNSRKKTSEQGNAPEQIEATRPRRSPGKSAGADQPDRQKSRRQLKRRHKRFRAG